MKININWKNIPTHTIDIGELDSPYDICLTMKFLQIDWYVYRIMFKGIVIKFGMSADKSRSYGERIYRQIGHSKSWGSKRLYGSSGSDWRVIEEDFYDLYGYPIDKNFIKIKVWDLTNYPFETLNPYNEVLAIESSLIQQYNEVCGEKPIGNIHDDENIFRRPSINKSTWNDLFQT